MIRRRHHAGTRQRGAAVLVMMLVFVLVAAFFAINTFTRSNQNERNRLHAGALAEAREALIGYAATYRDDTDRADEVFGFLPCPDGTNNDGAAEGACAARNVSLIGRLPWKTLGVPALRDGANECLWYALSGHAKNNPKTAIFNWDTLGQFVIQDADGKVLAGATPHEQPLAVVFGPGMALRTQNRAGTGSGECGGNASIAAYLEGNDPIYASAAPAADAVSMLTLATGASERSGSNNDRGIWITSRDIFGRIKQRSDFKSDIDTMIGDLANCLNFLPTQPLPGVSSGNKGIDNVITQCPARDTQRSRMLDHWRDNLLYARPPAAASVNGNAGCDAVLLFGGERTLRTVAPLTAQSRANATEKTDATMYLEGGNATLFPGSGPYVGARAFSAAHAEADIVRCLKNPPPGGARLSFANDLASFSTAIGNGSNGGITLNSATNSVDIGASSGSVNACLWRALPIPLAGKILRAHYRFTFTRPDAYASGGEDTDRGNGFTVQLLHGDGNPPTTCGNREDMGVLKERSIVIETDVRQDAANNDPPGNHTAIMLDSDLTHSAANGQTTTACDGSAAGCQHAPTNRFEEAPPTRHQQRIEIHTGCNPACSSCTPAGHAAPNTYARVSVWVDCVDCDDTVIDLDRALQAPTINRCVPLDSLLNSVYFGFTGGFRPGAARQGVTLENLYLRSE